MCIIFSIFGYKFSSYLPLYVAISGSTIYEYKIEKYQ